ncbi:alpha-IPM isomerase [Bordetella sp. BOR01]|uniref:LeuD/DmdB family oxidoreductase small subunit n=1 Tax=Bordetella sp. BOR01 TaxID=2854779 RepID=UPI001C481873|nr:alpha-IPM isomerase [Bordetella sp. BOR01]MBV7482378.1 alpha-IPM isomerase [Bordetella sp. BOR01]
MRVKGCATLLGDDIDTDTIFPGRYLAVLRPEDQAKHLFEPLDAELRQRIVAGGVVIGGWNFGCGSSREHAVTSMLGAGIRLVVAKSFSRIFFRNAVNNGLAVVISPELVECMKDGEAIEADLQAGKAYVPKGEVAFTPLPSEVLSILVAGGLWAAKTNKADIKVLQ